MVLSKLGEPVKKVRDGRLERALDAVEGGIDNLLAQVLPEALNQVQRVNQRESAVALAPERQCQTLRGHGPDLISTVRS